MNFRILSLLPVILLLFSCTRHQYFTISSHLPQEENGSFLFENDTVKVSYSFTPDGKIEIGITNKLNNLIYADWGKSAMVFESISLPYKSSNIDFDATSQTIELIDGIETTDLRGTIYSQPSRTYIPPKSKISKMFDKVPISYKNLKTTDLHERVNLPSGIGKKYTFQESDSLNFYHSYIYLSDNDESKSYVLNHDFWVSEVLETLDGSVRLSPTQFKKSKLTSTGYFIALIGLVGIIIVSVGDE